MMTIHRRMLAATLLTIGWFGADIRLASERASAEEPKKQQQLAGSPLAGVVVDPNGKPLADADVWLVTALLDGKPGTLGKTKTDESGRFNLAVPDWWFQIQGLRQELGLIAAREGFRLGAITYSSSSVPPQSGIRLQLGMRTVSSMTVLAPDKSPLPKAKVAVQELMVDRFESGMSEEEAGRRFETSNRKLESTPNGYLWGRGRIPLPEQLRRRLTATTNELGMAHVEEFSTADVAGLEIGTDRYGTQTVSLVVRHHSAAG
jgi:hypothetical protein